MSKGRLNLKKDRNGNKNAINLVFKNSCRKNYKYFMIIMLLICIYVPTSQAAETVSIVLCEDVTNNGEPITPTETFSHDTQQIRALVTIEGSKAGSVIKGKWVSVDAIDVPDYSIGESQIQAENTDRETICFSVSRPDNGWPAGNYRIEVSINGQIKKSALFKITPKDVQTVTKGSLIELRAGLNLQCPAGWQPYREPNRVILRHTTISGTIVIFTHMDTTLQQVQTNMQIGISEPTARLTPTSAVQVHSNNAVAADYSGTVDGQQMKACGIGTFSEYGGVYVIAMAAVNQYSQQLMDAANSVVAGLQYTQQHSQNFVRHFAGQWWSYNEGAYQTAYLSPDGRFSDTYEYSAHVENRDQYGDWTSTGTILTNEQTTGRWSVHGNASKGILTITYNDGTQDILNYQVHVENGQVYYNEYWFEGQLWNKGPLP